MTPALQSLLAPLDRSAVEAERNRLREELADYEALLRLIDRHGAGNESPAIVSDHPPSKKAVTNGTVTVEQNGHNGSNGSNEMRAVPLSEKREAVLAIMRERHGRWTTATVREALAGRGIDPKAGTPVKNILWQMSKAGVVSPSGGGVYQFPALTATDDREQGALGL